MRMLVAHMERSEMRDRLRSRAIPAPDFASLHPGYGFSRPLASP